MEEVTVAMVALGGYGNFYLQRLLGGEAAYRYRLVAGIDPNPVGCRYLDELQARSIPIFPDLDHFYAEQSADLVIIAAPIHLHKPFTLKALAHGSNVLCEKPVAPTVQDAREMAEAEAASGRFVGIGYQWSYAEAIQALKRDVIAGVLGSAVRLTTKVLWPRPLSYYRRNNWAARIKASDGSWLLDSPANNATAHYLHNCFYVLGESRATSARPVDVQAELYRANDIENYDTAAIRCHVEGGAEIVFLTAHPVDQNIGPTLRYEFEQAVVSFDAAEGALVAEFRDGRVKDYGNPFADEGRKIWEAIDAVRTGAPMACSIAGATSHTLAINGAQESVGEIMAFPVELIRRQASDEDTLTYVEGLLETLKACYDAAVLPAELGTAPWARAGEVVDLRGYDRYPRRQNSPPKR